MLLGDYGFWDSPITTEKAAAGSISFVQLEVDGDCLYCDKLRPANQGNVTLVFLSEGVKVDMTPPEFNCRTAVHEMGGGAFTVSEGTLYANNFNDKNLYKKLPGYGWKKLTSGCRFADMRVTKHGIIAVGELHQDNKEAENFLALIDSFTGEYSILASGYDFYSSPAVNCDETKVAWLCWNHPQMPWYETELWVAELDSKGKLINQRKIAGDLPEAIFQPQWSKEGVLHFVSDREEWWNLYKFEEDRVVKLFSLEAEIGLPNWIFRFSTWCFLGDKILFTHYSMGRWKLSVFDLATSKITELPTEGISFRQLREGENCVYFIEEFFDKPAQVVKMDAVTFQRTVINTMPPSFAFEDISVPQHIEYPSAGGRSAYGFYYPPKNSCWKGPEGKKPPLLVMIHGGPHSMASPVYSLSKQFWTSRGFAILDVNYGGSTGYGRSYRYSLHGSWGIVDVEDCIYGAKYLVKQGLVDPEALFIRGGSAGGFTTLAALAFDDTFKGGANYYGVADLMALANDTHKFESRYLESLLGPLPEMESLWKERSPLNHVDRFKAPLIIFQGSEDAIIPPNQSMMIYEALKKRGIPTEITIYEGEQHGFRKKETIIDSLEKELKFYQKICEGFKSSIIGVSE